MCSPGSEGVCACVRVCVCVCVHACVRARVHVCMMYHVSVQEELSFEKSSSVGIRLQLPGDGKDSKQQIKQIGSHSQIDVFCPFCGDVRTILSLLLYRIINHDVMFVLIIHKLIILCVTVIQCHTSVLFVIYCLEWYNTG